MAVFEASDIVEVAVRIEENGATSTATPYSWPGRRS